MAEPYIHAFFLPRHRLALETLLTNAVAVENAALRLAERTFWQILARLSQRQRRGPVTASEIRRVIEEMASANLLWRALWIHGELSTDAAGVMVARHITVALFHVDVAPSP